jgi:hypothetical protein
MSKGVARHYVHEACLYLDCHGQVGLSNESLLRPGEEDKGDAVRAKSDMEVNTWNANVQIWSLRFPDNLTAAAPMG